MYAVVSAAPPAAASWASQQAATDATASPSQLLAASGSLDQAGLAQSGGMSGLSLQLPAGVTDSPHERMVAAVMALADTEVAAVAAVD